MSYTWDKIGIKIVLFVIYIIMMTLALGGLVGIGITTQQVYLAHQSSNWPTVLGVITYSEIRVIKYDENITNNGYEPIVKYDYQVNENSFTGDRISFSTLFFRDLILASKILESYPVNQKIIVYYEDDNPQNSVLEAGITKKTFVPLIGSIFIFTFFTTVTLFIWCFN